MADIVNLLPPQRNLPSTVLTPDHMLQAAQEADLKEVLIIGRTGDGELYYCGAKTGLYQQTRTDISRLCQDMLDELLFSKFEERRR